MKIQIILSALCIFCCVVGGICAALLRENFLIYITASLGWHIVLLRELKDMREKKYRGEA